MNNQLILVVDDEVINLDIMEEMLSDHYSVITASSGSEALEMATVKQPDLILLDVMMDEPDGYEVCRRLRNDPILRDIPVIFITALSSDSDQAAGFKAGAVDFITKPLSETVVLARVRTHLELKGHRDRLEDIVRDRTAKLRQTQLNIVKCLGHAAEFRDNETGMHIHRMSYFCELMAKELGMDDNQAELLATASTMHDVGKIGIPDKILLKPGKLTFEEFEIMKQHTVIGHNLLPDDDSELLKLARKVALLHHEKWEGGGYPQGLKGEEIPLECRIVAICDVYDALTSERPYKRAWSPEEALAQILKGRGTHFEPEITDKFEKNFDRIVQLGSEYSD
ncbi:HD domain-containing phosphohydrolase [Limisalsivibrio acetivorans]|uniref:HD domain-containing phosphohydrolase n=1 Tax=Limisalsivibrio acetivorans TaxID=1304888 RepID=UPI0003B45B48|nr:HD domain-containing phosphohydrolase [Limisalsivibrio acetivorans]